MTAQSQMFTEAMAAIDQGDKHRAKDLFTRLIKQDANQLDYWLWMSAVVETPRERAYCLKEVLRIDPQNQAARRGLILLGALPKDETLAIPLRYQQRNWQGQMQKIAAPEPVIKMRSWKQAAMFGGAVVALVLLLFVGANSLSQRASAARFTPWPQSTFIYISPTPTVPTVTPTYAGPVPLWMQLAATYTPTPLYVATPHPISESYRSAMRAYDKQDWPTMLSFLQQVVTIQPDAPDVVYYQGEAYRFQGAYARAVESYNRSIAISPAFAPAYLGRARAVLANSPADWKNVQADLEKAAVLDPNLVDTYLELAQIDLNQQDAATALLHLDMASTLAPNSLLLYVLRSQAYHLVGDDGAALTDALHIQQVDMTYLPGYRQVGEVYRALGEPEKAIESLETYITYVKDDPLAYAWLGDMYTATGDIQKAKQAFGRSLVLDPKQFDALLSRGVLNYRQAEYDAAEADLSQALILNSKSFEGNMALGMVYMAQERYGNAYMKFSEAEAYSKTDAQEAEIYYNRALSLEKLDEAIAAIKDWKALLALTEDSSPAEWAAEAEVHLSALYTPTVTPKTPTSTHTRMPTLTPTSTRTPLPTFTPVPTRTPTTTRTPTRTSTSTPTRTSTPALTD